MDEHTKGCKVFDLGDFVVGKTLPWPRYANGRPVTVGDFHGSIEEQILAIDVTVGTSASPCAHIYGAIREAVFDADDVIADPIVLLSRDGLPIKAGDCAWKVQSGDKCTVCGIESSESGWLVVIWLASGGRETVAANELTFECPDDQAAIDRDARMDPLAYCAMRGMELDGIRHADGAPQRPEHELAIRAMVVDLLARQRTLDARTNGKEL